MSERRLRLDCARYIYSYGIQLEPNSAPLYEKALEFERMHGDETKYIQLLERAIQNNKTSQEYWIKITRVFVRKNETNRARETL